MKFSERLRYWRTFRDLTQEQLAHACGFSGQSRIANYESDGDNQREPSLDDLPALAKALDISVEALLSDEAFKRTRELLKDGYVSKPVEPLSLRESRLVENYRLSEDTGKAAIETTATALARREVKKPAAT